MKTFKIVFLEQMALLQMFRLSHAIRQVGEEPVAPAHTSFRPVSAGHLGLLQSTLFSAGFFLLDIIIFAEQSATHRPPQERCPHQSDLIKTKSKRVAWVFLIVLNNKPRPFRHQGTRRRPALFQTPFFSSSFLYFIVCLFFRHVVRFSFFSCS